MNLRDEIINARKVKLGLTEKNTKKIFDLILQTYKETILDAPRNIMGYTIDLIICDMSGYNKLGGVERLYNDYKDIVYVDMNNSTYLKNEVDEDGNTVSDCSKRFKECSELEVLQNISFSIKEFIELCKENDIYVRLFAKDDYDTETALEIEVSRAFNDKEESILEYLKQVK